MRILLFGDFAIPYLGAIDIDSLMPLTDDKIVIGNLEGPLITRKEVKAFDRYKINLCADRKCVDYLKVLNIDHVSFANNHILDYRQTLRETISVLDDEGINFFGTADRPYIEFQAADIKFCIWGAVSYITGRTSNKYDKINEFKPRRLLRQIRDYKQQNPEVFLILYLHWGYEFAMFPQPADREWAIRAIDMGANVVAGVHPHEVQGIEKHENGTVIYSLGNYIQPSSDLTRPHVSDSFSKSESDLLHLPKIGIEINPLTDEILIHDLFYDPKSFQLLYRGESNNHQGNSLPFNNFSFKQYRRWYRGQKYKGEQRSRFNLHPNFYSYFGLYNAKFHLARVYLMVFKMIRRLLISMKFHTPTSYHELTKKDGQDTKGFQV